MTGPAADTGPGRDERSQEWARQASVPGPVSATLRALTGPVDIHHAAIEAAEAEDRQMNEYELYRRRERRNRVVAAILAWVIVTLAVVGLIGIVALVIVTFG